MEGLNEDVVILQCFRSVPSESYTTDGSSNSEQKEQRPPESKQETPELRASPPALGPIDFRMQQLHNRRILLLKIQHCIKKEQNSDESAEENEGLRQASPALFSSSDASESIKLTPPLGGGVSFMDQSFFSEDGEELCELEAIQKELEELEVKKKELMKNRRAFKPKANTGQQDLASYKETPHGGIYMLPPLQPDQRGEVVTATADTATHSIVPAEELGQMGGVTKCPSCEAVIITETHSSVGEAVWIACFLSFMMGCVAGCCLIPFYVKRLRSVNHRCPTCQTHIHTHQPF